MRITDKNNSYIPIEKNLIEGNNDFSAKIEESYNVFLIILCISKREIL